MKIYSTPYLKLCLFWVILFLTYAPLTSQNTRFSSSTLGDSTFTLNPTKLESKEFNQGLMTDPLQLIQSQFPSLLISRGGNDPNGQYDFRIRGIKSFDVTQPLILIDGLPTLSLDAIHPNDIGSVEVLKDGAAIAKYGIRGSNGVILIETKKGTEERIQYHGYVTTESITRKPNLLGARAYVNKGGFDMGGSTDWWDEITQRASSQVHHISMSGGSENFNYYAAINYDGVNGVLKNTGFERINNRLTFEQRALNNKLTIRGSLGHTERTSDFILPFTIEQAISYNPTSPIYGEGEEFEKFGGYYERYLFNNYNPVSLIEQIDLNSSYQQLNANLQGEFEIANGISISGQYAQMRESWKTNLYVPSTSFYLDYRNGFASSTEFNRNNFFTQTSLDIQQKWGEFDLNASLSYFHQQYEEFDLGVNGGDFLTDVFSYNNFSASNDFPNGYGSIASSRSTHKLIGYGLSADMGWKNKYFLSLAVRNEGSSRLGRDAQWGLFYGLNTKIKLNDRLSFRANYSQTGNLPGEGLLSQEIYSSNFYERSYYNGEFEEIITKVQNANPELQWENTMQWGLGTDFKMNVLNKPLYGSLDLYRYRSSELILEMEVNVPPNTANTTYRNVGGLKGGGLEFSLFYEPVNRQNFTWQIGLRGSQYFKTILEDYGFDATQSETYVGVLGGRCSFPVYRLREGYPLGEIWGHTFRGTRFVSADGHWDFQDRDQDGYFSRNDYAHIGNAMPRSSFGITNQVTMGNIKVAMMIRGVFGHDMINHIKSFYSTPALLDAYNILSDPSNELFGLYDYPDFSERDVERASFIRLGYLTLSYDIPKPEKSIFEHLNVYITAQNLFTITGYSGLDPELRMTDEDMTYSILPFPYKNTGNPLVHGQDRANAYLASRTFLVGVKIGL